MSSIVIVSNNVGPNGEPIDRIYGSPASGGSIRLVNADYTTYKGNIIKKTIYKENSRGEKVKTKVFVTDDNRWFDVGGMPMLAPDNIEEEDESSN